MIQKIHIVLTGATSSMISGIKIATFSTIAFYKGNEGEVHIEKSLLTGLPVFDLMYCLFSSLALWFC